MNLELLLRPTYSLRASLCEQFEAFVKPYYVRLLKKNKIAWNQTRQTLGNFPPGTLGHDTYRFLSDNGLELIPQLEDHDMFHVLFALQPTIPDEIRLQALLLGNGRRTLYAWLTAMIGFALFPEYQADIYRAYRQGRRYRRCVHWRFEYLLQEPTEELRAFIFDGGRNLFHPPSEPFLGQRHPNPPLCRQIIIDPVGQHLHPSKVKAFKAGQSPAARRIGRELDVFFFQK